eukprot:g5396.t1
MDNSQPPPRTNAVHGASFLSDKADLALLRSGWPKRGLDEFVVHGRSHFQLWPTTEVGKAALAANRFYIVKDAAANGGHTLWLASAATWSAVAQQLENDMTVRGVGVGGGGGSKFHLRLYAVLKADLSLYTYSRAFVHVASKPWAAPEGATLLFDPQIHITNRPGIWSQAVAELVALVDEASPLLRRQVRPDNFVLLGVDILCDADGRAFVLETNVPPCLTAQHSDPALQAECEKKQQQQEQY